MVLMRHAKWIYAASGSGVFIGIFNYLQSEKKCVQTSWTTNFEPSVKWDFNWDKRHLSSLLKSAKDESDPKEQNRANKKKEKKEPIVARHIILIRHGQYDMDGKQDEDKKLTTLGRKQADYVGKRLKEFGHKYTNITSSTMTRAVETSDIIQKYFPDVPVKRDDMLREGAPIPPEPPVNSYQPEEHEYFTDGARLEAAFRKYFHRPDTSQKSKSCEIIVCHGNVIRYFICRALQFPPEAWLRFALNHCSITWIAMNSSGTVAVFAVGDSGFIPADSMSL